LSNILIIGGTSSIAVGFIRHYLLNGDVCAAVSRRPKDAVFQQDKNLEWIQADLSHASGMVAFKNALSLRETQPIDTLICCIGYTGPQDGSQNWPTITAEAAARVLHVNVITPCLAVQAALPRILLSRAPRIVFLGSKAGSSTLRGKLPHHIPGGNVWFSISKAALHNVAVQLAYDLAIKGVAIGVLHPGWIASESNGYQGTDDLGVNVAKMIKIIASLDAATPPTILGPDGNIIPW